MEGRNSTTSVHSGSEGSSIEEVLQSSQQDLNLLHRSYHSGLALAAAYYAKQNLPENDGGLTQRLLNAGFTREVENLYVDKAGILSQEPSDSNTKLDFHFTTQFEEAFSQHTDNFPAEFTLPNFMDWINTILLTFKSSALKLFTKDQTQKLTEDYPEFSQYMLRNYFNFFLMRLMQSFSVLFANEGIQMIPYQASTNVIMGLVDCEAEVDPNQAPEWNIESITQSMLVKTSLVATPWLTESEQFTKEGICTRVDSLAQNIPQGFEEQYQDAEPFFDRYQEHNQLKEISVPRQLVRLLERNQQQSSERTLKEIETTTIKKLWGQLITSSDAKLLPFNLQAAYLQRGIVALRQKLEALNLPLCNDQLDKVQGFFNLLITIDTANIAREEELFVFYHYYDFLLGMPDDQQVENYIEQVIRHYASSNQLSKLDIPVFYALARGFDIKSLDARSSMAHWQVQDDASTEEANIDDVNLAEPDALSKEPRRIRFAQSNEVRQINEGRTGIERRAPAPMQASISERTKHMQKMLTNLSTMLENYETKHGKTQNISAMRSILANAPNTSFAQCADQCHQLAAIAKTRREKIWKRPTLRSFYSMSSSGHDRQQIYDALAKLDGLDSMRSPDKVETTLAEAVGDIKKEKQAIRLEAFSALVARGVQALMAEKKELNYVNLRKVIPIDKVYVDFTEIGSRHVPSKLVTYTANVFRKIATNLEKHKLANSRTSDDQLAIQNNLISSLIYAISANNTSLSQNSQLVILDTLNNPADATIADISASYKGICTNALTSNIIQAAANTKGSIGKINIYVKGLSQRLHTLRERLDQNLSIIEDWISASFKDDSASSASFFFRSALPKKPEGLSCISAIICCAGFTNEQKRSMIQAVAGAKNQESVYSRDPLTSEIYSALSRGDFDRAVARIAERQLNARPSS